MQVDNEFKQAIADTFYDKTFEIYSNTVETDEEGHTTHRLTQTGTIKGNIHFRGDKMIQEMFGLREEVDGYISTNDSIEKEQYFKYDGKMYRIIEVLKYETHNIGTFKHAGKSIRVG